MNKLQGAGAGESLDLGRILSVTGELPPTFYACSALCRKDFAPTKKACSSEVHAIRRRLSDALTRHLNTDIRAGDAVHVFENLSPHRNFHECDGTVESLHYDSSLGTVMFTVKTITNGTVKVGLEGLESRGISQSTAALLLSPPPKRNSMSGGPPPSPTTKELKRLLSQLEKKLAMLRASLESQSDRALQAERDRDAAHDDALNAEVVAAAAEERREQAELQQLEKAVCVAAAREERLKVLINRHKDAKSKQRSRDAEKFEAKIAELEATRQQTDEVASEAAAATERRTRARLSRSNPNEYRKLHRSVVDAVSKPGMHGRQRRYGWIYFVYEREDKETWFNANRPSYFNGSKADSWRFVMDLEPLVDVEDYPERPQAEPKDEEDDDL